MKKFLIKLLLICISIFFIGLILLYKHGDKNYSSPLLNSKLKFIEQHTEYNTYFIGSSKINNQINCKIIDEINPELKSYNLGVNASFNLENFQAIDYILKNPNLKPRYVILELQDKIKITRANIHSERSFGAFNFPNTLFAVRFHVEENNYKQIAFSIYSFFLNTLHFNKSVEITNGDQELASKNQGFIPLDYSNKGEKRVSSEDLEKEIRRRLKVYYSENQSYSPNTELIRRLNKLYERCRKKNIMLIVLVPGPAEPDAKRLQSYYGKIKAPLISFLEPETTPEFYKLENRWDYGHLNEKGAEILSKKVSLKMKKIFIN